jgi:hypothetical protein
VQEELANVGVIEGARSALAALHHVLEHLLRHDTRQLPQIWNGIEMILDAAQALPIERFGLVQLQLQQQFFLFYNIVIPSCCAAPLLLHAPLFSFSITFILFFKLTRKRIKKNHK